MMLEPCPLWHWPLPGPGHWVLAMADTTEATVPSGSWTHTVSLLGVQGVPSGPFLPAGVTGTCLAV